MHQNASGHARIGPKSHIRAQHSGRAQAESGQAETVDPQGDLLEGIVLHAFEQKHPFGEETLKRIEQLKEVYGMDYDASASHRFIDKTAHNKPS